MSETVKNKAKLVNKCMTIQAKLTTGQNKRNRQNRITDQTGEKKQKGQTGQCIPETGQTGKIHHT